MILSSVFPHARIIVSQFVNPTKPCRIQLLLTRSDLPATNHKEMSVHILSVHESISFGIIALWFCPTAVWSHCLIIALSWPTLSQA